MALVLGGAGAGGALAFQLELSAGMELLVKYVGHGEWHARILCAEITFLEWIIVTPDADMYPEDYRPTSREIEEWRPRGPARGIPFGIRGGDIYDFAVPPDLAQMGELRVQGEQLARFERRRRRLPEPAARAPPPAAAGAPPAGVAALGALGAPGVAPPAAAAVAGLGALGAGAAGAAAAVAGAGIVGLGGAALRVPVDDARTLAIRYGEDNVRHREFREAAALSAAVEFADWPVRGPRTAGWWIKTVAEVASTPMGQHARFISQFRLGADHPVALQHESYSRILQTLVSYDQVDVTNLAAGELIIRQLQLLEERQQHASAAHDSVASEEQGLFMGTAAGAGATIISPQLKLWISTEMARDASVLKERRKAREERGLARPKAKGKAGKGGAAGAPDE